MIVEPTGTLCGEGFVYAAVENGGMVSPGASPGVLDIWGDFTQTSAGKLVLEIAGPTEFDSLRVHGQAHLAGKLDIVLRDGYIPGPTDSFLLFDAFSIEGAFDEINVSGGGLLLDFSPTGLVVQGVPEPSVAALVLVPIALLLFGRGRQRKLAGFWGRIYISDFWARHVSAALNSAPKFPFVSFCRKLRIACAIAA